MSTAFGVYVHVPYCRHVCPYCDFNVYAARTPPEADDVRALTTELAAHAARPAWTGRRVRSVYFGGGTPSLFAPATIGALLAAVDRGCGREPDAEVTLEANPGTVSAASLAAYRQAGVNRLSLGVQSFQPDVLRTLGRDHTADEARAAVHAARAAGFDDVSLDLIFAVAGQTTAAWEADLRTATALAPEHVSAYGLTYEEGTPFHGWRTSGRMVAVDEEVELAMAELAATHLAAAGYGRYEISSWARPGREARHNTGYWIGIDYLGLGPGAHSYCAEPAPGRRWSNVRRPDAYRAAVAASGVAIAEEEHLSEATARADFAITGLRRLAGIDLAAFARRFGIAFEAAFPHTSGLAREGLVERAAERLRLTARGLRFADTVAATFV